MVIAADYPFLDILWSMCVFFGFVVWFTLLIRVFADVFRRHDIGGGAKFAWSLFVLLVPLVGVLVYLVSQGRHIAERDFEQAKREKAALDEYIRETVRETPGGGTTPA